MQSLDPVEAAIPDIELERCGCLTCRLVRDDMRQLKRDMLAAIAYPHREDDDAA